MQARAASLASAKPRTSAGFSKTLDAGATHPAALAASRVTGPQSTVCDESSFECPMSRSAEVGVPLNTYFLTSRKVAAAWRSMCTRVDSRGKSRRFNKRESAGLGRKCGFGYEPRLSTSPTSVARCSRRATATRRHDEWSLPEGTSRYDTGGRVESGGRAYGAPYLQCLSHGVFKIAGRGACSLDSYWFMSD